jgi:hypothetical protein
MRIAPASGSVERKRRADHGGYLPAVVTPELARPWQVQQLQRSAGNAAVSRMMIQRQEGGPADAGASAGAPSQAKPTNNSEPTSVPPTAAEQAAVVLPPDGSVRIVFSDTPRSWKLDTSEIDKLKIGKGSLSTPPIPAGKWLSVAAEIGEEQGAKVNAGLTLSPIVGEISASHIAEKKPKHETAGKVGAAVGGVSGGLAGALVGGTVLGLPGAVYGLVKGAELGGVHVGKNYEAAAGLFDGRLRLTATLLQGSVGGSLGFHYEPYLKVKFSATGFSWLADLDAVLKTRMDLRFSPSASLAESKVDLDFEGGRLVRTQFTLEPDLKIGMNFDSSARLSVVLRLLPFMDASKFPDTGGKPGASAAELKLYESEGFKLFNFSATRGTKSRLSLAKASPLELLESVMGLDDALSMKNLLPEAIKGGSEDRVPTAGEPPPPGAPGTGPTEADFDLSPGDTILAHSTGQRGGRQGWFRGEVLPFERRPAGPGGSGSELLYLVYRVDFPDQPVTVRTESAAALNDLRRGDAAERLRYYQDPVLRETLQPFLDDPLLNVGPNDSGSIPASGPKPSKREQDLIQPIGNSSGCHIGTGHSTGGQSWVADHQRPTRLIETNLITGAGPQSLYPMCPTDSQRQGTLVAKLLRMWLGRAAR